MEEVLEDVLIRFLIIEVMDAPKCIWTVLRPSEGPAQSLYRRAYYCRSPDVDDEVRERTLVALLTNNLDTAAHSDSRE